MIELIRQGILLSGVVVTALACPGCASGDSPKLRDDVASLKKQVWALEKRVSELGLRVSYNSGDIARLKAHDEQNRSDADDADDADTTDTIALRGENTLPPVVDEPPVVEPFAPVAEKPLAPVVVEPAPVAEEPVMVAQVDSGPTAATFNGLAAEEIYRKATVYFNQRDYGMAGAGFDYLIRAFPLHDLAPYAQYWIGESLYVQKRFDRAWEAYQKLRLRWPDTKKLPDAMLKSGLCKLMMNEKEQAKATLTELIGLFPDSAAANHARRTLGELEQDING